MWVILEEVWDRSVQHRLSVIRHSMLFDVVEAARDEACRLSLHEGPDTEFTVVEEGSADETALYRFCQGAEL